MAEFVIKKDGSKEPFDAEKIRKSITVAASKAGLSEEQINKVAEHVSGVATDLTDEKEEITTAEIKEKILSELDALEPSVSEVWRKYDQEKGKA